MSEHATIKVSYQDAAALHRHLLSEARRAGNPEAQSAWLREQAAKIRQAIG